MAGPRVTGPVAKLARSITTSAQPSTLLTSSKAGAPLSRKYADLLKERNTDPDVRLPVYTGHASMSMLVGLLSVYTGTDKTRVSSILAISIPAHQICPIPSLGKCV